MDRVNWRSIIELTGAISIVSSLIFVGLELRQTQSAIANERTISRTELANDVRSEINQYLDVWLKGNSDEELTELESQLYKNLLDSRWAAVDATGFTGVALGNDISGNPGIVGFSAFLYRNPGARAAWLKSIAQNVEQRKLITGQSEYISPTISIVMDQLAVLDSSN